LKITWATAQAHECVLQYNICTEAVDRAEKDKTNMNQSPFIKVLLTINMHAAHKPSVFVGLVDLSIQGQLVLDL